MDSKKSSSSKLKSKKKERRKKGLNKDSFAKIPFLDSSTLPPQNAPKISIISSVYNGDLFIKDFLEDIVKQTIFNQCELILINAASPGSEELIINQYMKKYKNIIYIKLGKDPGLYASWNLAIKIARGLYLTNANIDDRLCLQCYQLHLDELEKNNEIDLVYSASLVTEKPNETLETTTSNEILDVGECVKENFLKGSCPPGNHPMWRASLHTKYGFFDESLKIVGDYEMWLRAISQGAKFERLNYISGLFYRNPAGLSTNKNNRAILNIELERVYYKYHEFLGYNLDEIVKS